jgi:hypothetical protein
MKGEERLLKKRKADFQVTKFQISTLNDIPKK